MTPPYGFPASPVPEALESRQAVNPFILSTQLIKDLTPLGQCKSWRQGDFLVHYGQRVERVSVCLDGRYRILLNSVDGHSHFVRRITAGEMFGVPSALAGAPFPTDVVCEEPGRTLEIPRHVLVEHLRTEPELAMGIIKSLATRVAEMFEMMESDLLPSLRARVYQRLQRLARFDGLPDRFGHVAITLTQQEIAQSLNASRSKVNLELKRLEREGAIRLGYGRITLLRPPRTPAEATSQAGRG